MAKLLGLLLATLTALMITNPVHANKVVVTNNLPASDSVNIESGKVYEQKFKAVSDELGLIDLYITSIDTNICSEIRYGLGKKSEVMVDKLVDLSTARRGDFYSIGFEPITTIPGEDYWFGVMRVDENNESCLSMGINKNTYFNGELSANNQVVEDADLVFRLAYDQPVGEYIKNNLGDELQQKYKQQQIFLFLYALLLVSVTGILIYSWKWNDE